MERYMLENIIDNEQAKIKPYRATLEVKTLTELQAMVGATASMKLDKRLGKTKLIDYMMQFFLENGYPTHPEYKPNPTAGLAEIPQVKPADSRPLHPVLQVRDFKKEQEEELARNLEERRVRMASVERQSQKLDTEFLDAIARAFQGQPNPTYDEAFPAKLISVCMMLVNLFDDGNDVIIQAKLGDQITRMFEKMRDNVKEMGLTLRAELRAEQRASNNTEINMNKIDDLNEKIQKSRQQWAILNNAFVICKDQLRPKILGQTGMNWGQYTTLEEMAKLNKRKANDRNLTLDNLLNNRDEFDKRLSDRHEDFGLVNVPDGL
jgi:hypothetical protein